jgi:predicted glutamine amidotransferase
MLLGLLQNDASLLACRLAQLRGLVRFEADEVPDAVGAGYVQNGHALVRRRPGSAPSVSADLLSLVGDVRATGLMVHVRRATVGAFKDENTHPFRYRNWLFGHAGTVARFGDLRPALLDGLPPFLRRGVAGETDSEHLFAVFLDEMRKAGALDALHLDPAELGGALARTVERVETLAASVGGEGQSVLNLVATNGRGLAACRRGPGPKLHHTTLGGLSACALHGLQEDAKETDPERLPHQNLRTVVVATRLPLRDETAWDVLAEDRVLAVGPDVEARLYPF